MSKALAGVVVVDRTREFWGSLAAVLDDWVTPASLVNGARGDCEDFALAKFWMLEMLGIDRSDLYVVVVQDEAVHLPHAYLAVRSGGEIWLLDSRTNRPLLPEELEGIVVAGEEVLHGL